MTEANSNAGGAGDSTNSGANNGGSANGGQGNEGDQNATVSKADHERALADLHKFKTQAREAQDQINNLQRQFESLKTEKMAESEDYKGLWESVKGEKEQLEERLNTFKHATVNAQRRSELIPRLKDLGLRDDAVNLIDRYDWKAIDVEVTNAGNFVVNKTDVERETDKFKLEHPYAFGKPKAPTVNGTSGGDGTTAGDNEPLTPDRIVAIEKECVKKGDMAPYYAAVKKYNEQKSLARN